MSSIYINLLEQQLFSNSKYNKEMRISEESINQKQTKREFHRNNDFLCKNNLFISTCIKQIKSYEKRFIVFETVKSVDMKLYQDPSFYQKGPEEYVLITYQNKHYPLFAQFLFHLPTPKLLLYYVMDSYSYLLNSLLKLQKNHICYFNLFSRSIVFSEENNRPLIQHFEYSLYNNKRLNEEQLCTIVEKTKNFSCKPVEIHLLFFILKNKKDTLLSYLEIEEISTNFVDNLMDVFSLFSNEYRKKYQESCVDYLKKYINQTKTQIVQDLLNYLDTWDNFSLSVLYLYFVGNMILIFDLKKSFINEWSKILYRNLDPDPKKRYTLDVTKQTWEHIFHNCNSWDFVESISGEKYQKWLERMT
jgi:hypothetical protein